MDNFNGRSVILETRVNAENQLTITKECKTTAILFRQVFYEEIRVFQNNVLLEIKITVYTALSYLYFYSWHVCVCVLPVYLFAQRHN